MSKARYVMVAQRCRASDDDDEDDDTIFLPTLTVYPSDELVDTGLVGPEGEAIMKREAYPIGFLAEH